MITVTIIVLLHVQALGIRYSDGRNKKSKGDDTVSVDFIGADESNNMGILVKREIIEAAAAMRSARKVQIYCQE